MEYVDGFKYGSGTSRNIPGQQNYIRFQLSLAHDIDFEDFLDKINAQVPELHRHNKLFKAFSNCKNYVVAGVLMRSHWKHIRTDHLEVVFSRGSGIQLGLFSRNLEPWKPSTGKKPNTKNRANQGVHVECDAKDASKLIRYFKYIFPSTPEAKKKIGLALALGYSFPCLAMGKP